MQRKWVWEIWKISNHSRILGGGREGKKRKGKGKGGTGNRVLWRSGGANVQGGIEKTLTWITKRGKRRENFKKPVQSREGRWNRVSGTRKLPQLAKGTGGATDI